MTIVSTAPIDSHRALMHLHQQDFVNYYHAMLDRSIENSDAEQEARNREDLGDILRSSWDDLTEADRGLIALLCNRLC